MSVTGSILEVKNVVLPGFVIIIPSYLSVVLLSWASIFMSGMEALVLFETE